MKNMFRIAIIGMLSAIAFCTYFPAVRFISDSGEVYGIPEIDNQPIFINYNYSWNIANNDIPNIRVWSKAGYNDALSSNEEDLWAVGGTYVFLTAQAPLEIVSSNANDSLGGTGAQIVQIHYLDTSYTEKSEIDTLKGTTVVRTKATDIFRVNNFRVQKTGTNGANLGNIDIRDTLDTPIYSRIAIGVNRARNIIYTVPKGKSLLVTSILFGCGSNVAGRAVKFQTKTTYDNIAKATVNFFMPYTDVMVQDGAVYVPLELPTMLPEKTDIKVSAISPDGATYGTVTLRGILITN